MPSSLTCGTTTPKGYLAKEAQASRMGHQSVRRHLPGLMDREDQGWKRQETSHNLPGIFLEVNPQTETTNTSSRSELARHETTVGWRDDVLPIVKKYPYGNKTEEAYSHLRHGKSG